MKVTRILTGKGLGMVVPALGFGWLLAMPAWGQTATAGAQPPAPSSAAPAATQAASAGSILKGASDAKPPQMMAAVTTDTAGSSVGAGAATHAEVHKVAIEIENLGQRLARLTRAQRLKWDQASAALPAFCHDWDRMLHERELNNLSHLAWHEQQGYKTATYTGYGQVQACQAKESDEGVPIGKVTYQEMNYYLAGKSEDDAKSHPKLLGTTNTLEIFSWEKDRWFY